MDPQHFLSHSGPQQRQKISSSSLVYILGCPIFYWVIHLFSGSSC